MNGTGEVNAIGPTATIIGRIKPILNMKDSKGDDD